MHEDEPILWVRIYRLVASTVAVFAAVLGVLALVLVLVCGTSPVFADDDEAAPAIVIDPGHGGDAYVGTTADRTLSSPNNAQSPSGVQEKDLTLELSKLIAARIAEIVEQRKLKLRVVLTRDGDQNLDFARRALICAKAHPVAAIVSIHFNASESHDANGSLVMIRQEKQNSNHARDHKFATALAEACAEGVRPFFAAAKARPPISDAHLHGGRGSNFFHQLALHEELDEVPKGFLEVEFIDNPKVEAALLGENHQAAMKSIAEKVAEHLVEQAASQSSGIR